MLLSSAKLFPLLLLWLLPRSARPISTASYPPPPSSSAAADSAKLVNTQLHLAKSVSSEAQSFVALSPKLQVKLRSHQTEGISVLRVLADTVQLVWKEEYVKPRNGWTDLRVAC